MGFIDIYMRQILPFFEGYDFMYVFMDLLFVICFIRIVVIIPLYALGCRKKI